MSKTDHLAKAKEYIAKGEDYYRKAAAEIMAAKEERPWLTWGQIGAELGRSHTWVQRLVKARVQFLKTGEFDVDHESGSNKRDEVTAKVLRDAAPKQIREIVRELPREQREALIEASHDATVNEIRAERAEHNTEPTAGDAGDFDPAEYWADTLIIRVNRNARELAALQKRAGGLLFGTMPPEEAFDYLHEAERLVAEARAAAQEQVRDRTEV